MTPARKIIDRCGGTKRTAELVGCKMNWIYKWTTAVKSGGLGGRVPERARRTLLDCARRGIVDLTPADFEDGWGG